MFLDKLCRGRRNELPNDAVLHVTAAGLCDATTTTLDALIKTLEETKNTVRQATTKLLRRDGIKTLQKRLETSLLHCEYLQILHWYGKQRPDTSFEFTYADQRYVLDAVPAFCNKTVDFLPEPSWHDMYYTFTLNQVILLAGSSLRAYAEMISGLSPQHDIAKITASFKAQVTELDWLLKTANAAQVAAEPGTNRIWRFRPSNLAYFGFVPAIDTWSVDEFDILEQPDSGSAAADFDYDDEV